MGPTTVFLLHMGLATDLFYMGLATGLFLHMGLATDLFYKWAFISYPAFYYT